MATISEDTSVRTSPVIVWDGAVRVVHWLIALLFIAAWYTHRTNLQWHLYAGYCLLTLVLFRIYWGFAGSTTARFAHFVKGPRSVVRYARGLFRRGPSNRVGHNPLGGLAVITFLGLLLSQCLMGLFVTDVDGLESGPLSSLISFDMSRTLSEWHGRVFKLLQLFVAVHLAAILFYFVAKRDNLVRPMLTGRKALAGDIEPLRFASWRHALVAALVIASIVWSIVRNG